MIKKTFKFLAITALIVAAVSCNSKDNNEGYYSYSSASTIISAVSLQKNDKVLKQLDSVYFSIDQENALIFNADSLPYGTRINGLVPSLTTDNPSEVELHIPRAGQTDTIVNYLNNSSDTVDFSNGPVRIRVVAADGTSSRTYTMRVNVHQVKTDSLVWSRAQQANLPSAFQIPRYQHTARTSAAIYCLTYRDGSYSMATALNPASGWTSRTVTFGFTPRIETFTGTDDALYILDELGNLYRSADGTSWTSTSRRWDNIYGNYGTELWGSVSDNGRWSRVSYPSGVTQSVEDNFPVRGTSQTVNYVFEMSARSQILLTGGVTASGEYSANTWGYDGRSWVCLTSKPMDYGLNEPTLVPYFVSELRPGTLRTTRRSALIAMFGERQDGTLNDTVYISRDFGVSWEKAGQELQLSHNFPPRRQAQGFVYTETLSSRAMAGFMPAWRELGTPRLPLGASLIAPRLSRADNPATSWECPFIYIFGGVNAGGETFNTLWRGAITAFTFRPLF